MKKTNGKFDFHGGKQQEKQIKIDNSYRKLILE